MRELLKQYMLMIYKITGDFHDDEFIDIGQVSGDDFNNFMKLKDEILTELKARNLSEDIRPDMHIPVIDTLDARLADYNKGCH